jgi:hypothetical protein
MMIGNMRLGMWYSLLVCVVVVVENRITVRLKSILRVIWVVMRRIVKDIWMKMVIVERSDGGGIGSKLMMMMMLLLFFLFFLTLFPNDRCLFP